MEQNIQPKKAAKSRECVICQTKSRHGMLVHGRMGIRKDLSLLIEKYGSIKVTKGLMCLKCLRRLQSIHKRVQQFRALCQKSPYNVITHKLVRVPPLKGKEVKPDIIPMKLVPISHTDLDTNSNRRHTDRSAGNVMPVAPKPLMMFPGSPRPSFAVAPPVSVGPATVPVPVQPQTYQLEAGLQNVSPSVSSVAVDGSLKTLLIIPNQTPPGALPMVPVNFPSQSPLVFPNPASVGQAPMAPVAGSSKLVHIAPKQVPVQNIVISPQDAVKQATPEELTAAPTPKTSKLSKDLELEAEEQQPTLRSRFGDHSYHLPEKSASEILSRHADTWLRFRNYSDPECLSVDDIKTMVSKSVEGSAKKLAKAALAIPGLRRMMVAQLMSDFDSALCKISNRKLGTLSCLKPVGYSEQTSFDWDSVIIEMDTVVPELLQLCLAALNRSSYLEKHMRRAVLETVPRIGMVFAILVQGRVKELNRVQRVISVLLRQNGCDGKIVYQKLNPLGLCMSYTNMLELMRGIIHTKMEAQREDSEEDSSDGEGTETGMDTEAADSVQTMGQARPGVTRETSQEVEDSTIVTQPCGSEGQMEASLPGVAQQQDAAFIPRFGGAKRIFLLPKAPPI
ncbi:uncharacterized protein LOC110989104 isoform X2 [Acanthaster planci]|nr:uncharacterized protein LOC110989104 isoform X2 [Acanthaster planci]XP_022108928.1 uncharacterized protein LOC110989104 isoform X2 [Acanthaster planci]XP_022108929.1 uncharacterized protein LOC110989104 isoform X2 [Acanthaster planci]XP_022108930.1 uncharacterized protein LOC110989104 isoform X2 [Acanthaster planci]